MHASSIVSDTPQRRRWPLAEKRRIVELTMQHGSSVRSISNKYHIHATTVSHWKSMYHKGMLDISSDSPLKKVDIKTAFLPVTIDTPVSALIPNRIKIGITLPNGITMHVESDFVNFPELATFVASIK